MPSLYNKHRAALQHLSLITKPEPVPSLLQFLEKYPEIPKPELYEGSQKYQHFYGNAEMEEMEVWGCL